MDKLKQVIAEALVIDIVDIQENFSKETCEEWDSFNHIVLISEIEKAFQITITIEESEKIDNLNQLIKLLEIKL